jgi:hypothetical protein
MKILPMLAKILLLICLVSTPCLAEDLYYAQSQAGDFSGSSCANAIAIGSIAWGDGTGKIGAGDTVHLCGTITSPLTIGGSGTDNTTNVITIKFETGAKFSAGTWGDYPNTGAIIASAKNYIVIDGGTNGAIETTANGTGLTYQHYSVGILVSGSHSWTVKNLSVINNYVRINGTEANAYGGAIQFRTIAATGNIVIDNCTVSDGNVLMYFHTSTTVTGVIEVKNTHGQDAGEGVIVMVPTGTASYSSVLIHDNHFLKQLEWSGQAEIHANLIHAWTNEATATINGLRIYNNLFEGQCGTNSTSLVFLEGYIPSPVIYNNIFYYNADVTGQGCGNGMFVAKGPTSLLFANNTLTSYTAGQGIGYATTSFGAGDSGQELKNNLFYNVGYPIYQGVSAIADSDYNVFYGGSAWSFADWKTAHSGFDTNSTESQPTIDANFVPTVADTVAKDKGCSSSCGGSLSNLTSYYTTDKLGYTRTGTYDIGAYEYGAGLPTSATGCTLVGATLK